MQNNYFRGNECYLDQDLFEKPTLEYSKKDFLNFISEEKNPGTKSFVPLKLSREIVKF
jgi:hypothetical protein